MASATAAGSSAAEAEAITDQLREIAQPVELGLFAGAINPTGLSSPGRMIMGSTKGSEGDYRDGQATGAWARELRARLVPG